MLKIYCSCLVVVFQVAEVRLRLSAMNEKHYTEVVSRISTAAKLIKVI